VSSLDTDLASTAWAAVTVALCIRVGAGKAPPELLAVAVVASALAYGTKTSVAPLCLLALIAALLIAPRRRRLLPVVASLVVALGVGGVWYLRNLIDHGSPLWPFVGTPGADPIPTAIDGLSVRFIDNPIGTLDGRVGQYLGELGAGPLLIAAAIVLALLCRDRALRLAGAAVAASTLIWAVAPVTGAPDGAAAFFTVTGARYLMPTILLAAGVLALVAARSGRVALAARGVLVVAAAWGAIDLLVGGDESPTGWILLAGALAGGGAVALLAGRERAGGARAWVLPATALACVIALLALAAYPSVFLTRFRAAGLISKPFEPTLPAIPEMLTWFDGQPDFTEESGPVRFADSALIGPLTGGGFEHDIVLLDPAAGCEEIDPGAGGWLILGSTAEHESNAAGCVGGLDPATTLGEGSALEIQVFRLGPGS
jgi:hypothetical protein